MVVGVFRTGHGEPSGCEGSRVSRDATRTLYRWFQLNGRLCLVQKQTKQQYSLETKKKFAERHLAGETKMDLAREFGLSSDRLVEVCSQK